MKTLYALFFVCLSVPALADILDVMPIGGDEDDVATVSMPAPEPIEDHSVGAVVDFYVDVGDDNVVSAATPAIKPDEGAELEGTSRADAERRGRADRRRPRSLSGRRGPGVQTLGNDRRALDRGGRLAMTY